MHSEKIPADTPHVEYYVLVHDSRRPRELNVMAKWDNEGEPIEVWWCYGTDFLRLARHALWLDFWQDTVEAKYWLKTKELWYGFRAACEKAHPRRWLRR